MPESEKERALPVLQKASDMTPGNPAWRANCGCEECVPFG